MKLARCPFCSGPGSLQQGEAWSVSGARLRGFWWWVVCKRCGARGPLSVYSSSARAEWVDMRAARRLPPPPDNVVHLPQGKTRTHLS